MAHWFASILIVCSGFSLLSAQSLADDIAKAKSVKLLEATGEDVVRIFSEVSPFHSGTSHFSREATRIKITYSSGKCNDTESYEVDPADWNVAKGRVVMIEVLPRENLVIDQLDLGAVKLRKDRLYRGIDGYHIYYNKREGVAVTTHGNYVDSVIFFPSSQSNSLLCRDTKIQAYYSTTEWKRDPQPKYACILRNEVADVVDVSVVAAVERLFSMKTTATDPENDVLTYNYHVTGGKIVGVGANVTWDLSEASPGSYLISAGVDDGCGICGKYIRKSITIP